MSEMWPEMLVVLCGAALMFAGHSVGAPLVGVGIGCLLIDLARHQARRKR